MKNKKSIAIAMTAASAFGAVVPAFADEIPGSVDKTNMKVDLSKINGQESIWVQVGDKIFEGFREKEYTEAEVVEATNDLKAIKTYIANKLAETYTDEEGKVKKKYRMEENYVSATDILTPKEDWLGLPISQEHRGYLQITLVDNTNLDEASRKDEVVKVYGLKKDFGFGQDIPLAEKTVTLHFDNNTVTKFNEETEKTETKSADLYKELDKLGYEIRKSEEKLTVITEEVENTYNMVVKIYAGPTTEVQVGQINLEAIKKPNLFDKKNLKNIPVSNDFVGHWAEDNIVDAMLDRIVDISKEFRPEDGISRAEFAKIAVNAYGVDTGSMGTTKVSFSDVSENSWEYKYVMALATRGYIKGFDGKFRPEDKITRQEAAVIVANLHKAKTTPGASVNGQITPQFQVEKVTTDKDGNAVHTDTQIKGIADDSSIATWADESVDYLLRNKKINGYVEDGKTNFKPANNIKRAEALVMITR